LRNSSVSQAFLRFLNFKQAQTSRERRTAAGRHSRQIQIAQRSHLKDTQKIIASHFSPASRMQKIIASHFSSYSILNGFSLLGPTACATDR
jgi:hypothetical protein